GAAERAATGLDEMLVLGGQIAAAAVAALDLHARVGHRRGHRRSSAPNVGEWRAAISLPLPRYMCTPHGRHGSKLRTVRMTSMPLKCSLSFSSKIGWPCTASSYGPGVP